MMTLRASFSQRGCKNSRMQNLRLTRTLPWPQPASPDGAAVHRSQVTSSGNAGVPPEVA